MPNLEPPPKDATEVRAAFSENSIRNLYLTTLLENDRLREQLTDYQTMLSILLAKHGPQELTERELVYVGLSWRPVIHSQRNHGMRLWVTDGEKEEPYRYSEH